MNKEQKAKWVKALRSGRYEQGTGALEGGQRFCCLGVANRSCRLHVDINNEADLTKGDQYIFLPREIQGELIRFNDDEKMPFDLIAGFIDTWIEPTE